MNLKRTVALFLVAGLLVTAAPAFAAKGGTNRPVKGRLTGMTETTVAGATVTSASSGVGNVSHMGKTAYTIASTQDWSGYLPTHPCGAIDAGGTIVMTAANGAQVLGTITGGEVCETTVAGPPYTSVMTVDITGGTGRFAGATGSFTSTGTSAFDGVSAFVDSGTLTGLISY